MGKVKYHGLILVRTNSSRLPNKCFLKFGSKTIIEHIIDRCLFYNIKPTICTTVQKKDDIIIKIAKKKKIPYFRGSEKNKIKRISDCCKKFKIKTFHTIDADDPFFCGIEIKKSINLLKKNIEIVFPSRSSANGAASVGFSATSSIFKFVNSKIKENTDTEMLWKFFKKKLNKKKCLDCLIKNMI